MSLSIWNEMSREEKNAAIRTCVRANMTAKEIGIELHATRNAVIGHANRNKIALLSPKEARDQQSDRGAEAVKREVKSSSQKIARPKRGGKRDAKFSIAAPEKNVTGYEYGGPVSMADLNSMTCRAPLWAHGIGKLKGRVREADVQFCGKTVKEGSPYCEECHARFYTKEMPAKKKRPLFNGAKRLSR